MIFSHDEWETKKTQFGEGDVVVTLNADADHVVVAVAEPADRSADQSVPDQKRKRKEE